MRRGSAAQPGQPLNPSNTVEPHHTATNATSPRAGGTAARPRNGFRSRGPPIHSTGASAPTRLEYASNVSPRSNQAGPYRNAAAVWIAA